MTLTPKPDLWVIGTASLDILHFARQTAHTIGGAGLYTALAARRMGARTGLFAPYPDPLPELLQPVVTQVHWTGPLVAPEFLPRLEIEHHGGGRATLLAASWGAEAHLTPPALPSEMHQTAFIHIAALSSAARQLEFLHALRQQRGDQEAPRLSVGTYARLVYDHPAEVRQLFEQADLFFMNENEANGLFGSLEQASTRPEALLFVTLGEKGALLIEGQKVTSIPTSPILEVDPTGAGDTFCGATLASLAAGLSPRAAAEQAVSLAAQTISAVGPAALLDKTI